MLLVFISTPSFFFGEFWTGVLLGGIGVPLLLFLLITAEDWWPFGDSYDIELEDETDRRAGAGVLVADYVDTAVLESIARQKNITPEPKESEKARSTTTEGSAGLQNAPLVGRLLKRRTEDERLKWEHREDHNVMLSRVLEKLDESGDLRRDLGHIPYVSLGDESVMDQLAEAAKEHSEAEAARESLSTVRARLMADEKREEFDRCAKTNDFVLVEGAWAVSHGEDGNIRLGLAELRPDPHRPPTEPVLMPSGVGLATDIPNGSLSDQGRSRFSGADQRAAVFGTPAAMSDGTLTISAVAVFGRYGVPEEQPHPMVYGGGAGVGC